MKWNVVVVVCSLPYRICLVRRHFLWVKVVSSSLKVVSSSERVLIFLVGKVVKSSRFIIIAASSSEWTGYLLKFWSFLSSETGDVILFYFYGRKLQVRREFFLCSAWLFFSGPWDGISFFRTEVTSQPGIFPLVCPCCSSLVLGHILCHHHDSWSHPLALLSFHFWLHSQ